jgi:hypothetical protein
VRGLPLLMAEVERRRAMRYRRDHAAGRKHVGRVAWIPRRGVDAEVVLDVDIGDPQLAQVAEDATGFTHVGILKAHGRTLDPPAPLARQAANPVARAADERFPLRCFREHHLARMRLGGAARREPAAALPREDERPRLLAHERQPRLIGEVAVPLLEAELAVECRRQLRLVADEPELGEAEDLHCREWALRVRLVDSPMGDELDDVSGRVVEVARQ